MCSSWKGRGWGGKLHGEIPIRMQPGDTNNTLDGCKAAALQIASAMGRGLQGDLPIRMRPGDTSNTLDGCRAAALQVRPAP